jgi:hypothetical protein
METYKKTYAGQENKISEKEPWTPEYLKSPLNKKLEIDSDDDSDSDDDFTSFLFPDSPDFDPLDTTNLYEDEEGEDEEIEDEDDDLDDEIFEEEGDFQEKDNDYREKEERDSF